MLKLSVSRNKKAKGMTLLEVIIVLGIMGVIAAGVVVLAQRAIDNQNISKLSQSLNTIQTAMIQSFRGKTSYPVVTNAAESVQLTDALVSMGRASDTDFANPFSGEQLEVFSTAANGVENKAFAVKIGNLSQEHCRAIISSVNELFSFIQVAAAGAAVAEDVHVDAAANATTGVIKSTNGNGEQFDITNLTHINNLCGGEAGSTGFYDVYVGSR